MNGLQRILAALSPAGTDETPVVVCYPGILERDHYFDICSLPWWTVYDPNPEVQARSLIEQNQATDFDWFGFGPGVSKAEQAAISIVVEGERVFRVDSRTGRRTELFPPVPGGTLSVLQENYPVIDDLDAFLEERVPLLPAFAGLEPGQEELSNLVIPTYGASHYAYYSIGGPQWSVSAVLGYEQYLELLATDPEPIYAAAKRHLSNSIQRMKSAAAAGCHGIWIEDCMMDMIGPDRYAQYNLPLIQELVQAIREAGMYSVHYHCGDPWPVMDLLLETGADALSLEESKKSFTIDIDDVVAQVQGKMTVLGNMDAIGVLEEGTLEDVRREVARQLEAGKRNGGRFIMSVGSPVTPGTPVQRMRDYVSMVREMCG
jgi:hypothetical protein